MAGWGDLFGKIAQQFPGRIERLKNEKEELLNERQILMSKIFSASASRRVAIIDQRVRAINSALASKASD